MGSWRQTTPQQVQDDLDGLLDASVSMAHDLLAEHGEFAPFGVAVTDEGEGRLLSGDPSEAVSEAMLENMYAGARAHRDQYRAVAFTSDTRVGEPIQSDAIRVEVEHRDSTFGMVVFAPYSTGGEGEVAIGELMSAPDSRRIWN
jgi:hypothetical protein